MNDKPKQCPSCGYIESHCICLDLATIELLCLLFRPEVKRCYTCGMAVDLTIEYYHYNELIKYTAFIGCCCTSIEENKVAEAIRIWHSRPIEKALQTTIDAQQKRIDELGEAVDCCILALETKLKTTAFIIPLTISEEHILAALKKAREPI